MGEKVTKAILERNMRYSMMTSIAAINERGIDGMKLLRDRGLTLVQVGIESLSDTNLKKTRKVSDVKRIENTISILNSLGIKVADKFKGISADALYSLDVLAFTVVGDSVEHDYRIAVGEIFLLHLRESDNLLSPSGSLNCGGHLLSSISCFYAGGMDSIR